MNKTIILSYDKKEVLKYLNSKLSDNFLYFKDIINTLNKSQLDNGDMVFGLTSYIDNKVSIKPIYKINLIDFLSNINVRFNTLESYINHLNQYEESEVIWEVLITQIIKNDDYIYNYNYSIK